MEPQFPLISESATDHIDYYPGGWTETVHEAAYVEWSYDDDPVVFVQVDGTDPVEGYIVTPVTGVNDLGEEFVTRPIDGLEEARAFDVAATLIYAINGATGRANGEAEFSGDA
jgi:hypothetical protein